jgi:MFS family permease
VIGTIASVAPTLGPVIGGGITDTLDWHWLFYMRWMRVAGNAGLLGPSQARQETSRQAVSKGSV